MFYFFFSDNTQISVIFKITPMTVCSNRNGRSLLYVGQPIKRNIIEKTIIYLV